LDEIQLVSGWALFARRLLDSENIELFLSGSSARLLSREVATSMRGFPEAQGLDTRNRLELLRTYVDVVLLRDVVERHNLSQPQVLHWMVRQTLNDAGKSTRARCTR
jgi:predicted AAA+ superfamily ATPase